MFGSSLGGASAYAKVGVETGVASGSPHELIVMLFDGAIVAISTALQHMQTSQTAKKGAAISKAISIIDNGLRASLDKSVGGEIALNLDALYEYISNRLLIANLKNQPELLEEALQLLKGLRDAWVAIAPSERAPVQAAQPMPAPKAANYDALAPQAPSRLVKA